MADFGTIFLQKSDSSEWQVSNDFAINRGFLFGDGIFETMVMKGGKIRFSHFHGQRLEQGCGILGLDATRLSTIEEIESQVSLWVNGLHARIRWNVYREGMGKYTPDSDQIRENMVIQAFHPAPPVKQKAFFSKGFFVPKTPWSHCKTLNALVYVLANRERKANGMDEVILLDSEGNISEAGAANIFWEKDGSFFTPSLECSCIEGVGRKVLLEYFKKSGIPCIEGKYTPDQLLNADRVFVSNATGISLIGEIEGKIFSRLGIEDLKALFY